LKIIKGIKINGKTVLKEKVSRNKTAKYLAGLTLHLVGSYQEKYNRLADKRGLTQAEFKCVRLFGSDKRLNNKIIAKRMNLSESRLTRIIDGLEEKGYITRESDPKDSRSVSLTLTRKGRSLINTLDKHNVEIHHKILKNLKASQYKSLVLAMETLNYATEKWKWKIK
jgi:DNA-binding MarR family transcriptional regulator